MSNSERFPSSYLNVWESANLLAFGVAAEDAGQQWRENEFKKAGLDPKKVTPEERGPIEEDESYRFVSAIKCLMTNAEAGPLQVYGRRKRHSTLEPIPKLFWANGEIDVLGDDGGGAHPKDFLTHDYQDNEWVGLRYLRSEIEDLRRQIIQRTNVEEAASEKRKTDAEKEAKLRNRIKTILAADQKLPSGSSVHARAKELERTYGKELGLGFEAIRKILAGTYGPMKRLGVSRAQTHR